MSEDAERMRALPDQRPTFDDPSPTGGSPDKDSGAIGTESSEDDSMPDGIDQTAADELSEPVTTPGAPDDTASGMGVLPARPELISMVASLMASVEELRTEVKGTSSIADRQADLLGKLNSENERLRQGEVDRLGDPFVRDMIVLADTCVRNSRAWRRRETVVPADVERVLTDVAQDIELILARQGIESFAPMVGAPFNRREQRAARVDETSEAVLDGTVAALLRPAYKVGDRTIRYAEVAVWRFVENPIVGQTAPESERTAAEGSDC